MRIFVTGATGYVGRPTVTALLDRGHEVTALARTDESAEVVAKLGAHPVSGALTDLAVLRAAAADADAVIHLGQASGDSAAVDLAAATALQDGLDGGRYVHTGGVWVYGDTDGVVDETAPLDPPALVRWRLANERQVLERGGHPVVVLPGLVYGDHAGLIEACYVEPARERGAVTVIGTGANHWALVHRDDIADLYARAVENAPAGGVYAGVGGVEVTAAEVAEALSRRIGHPGCLRQVELEVALQELGPIADAFALDQRISAGKAKAELGWQPRHDDPLGELAQR